MTDRADNVPAASRSGADAALASVAGIEGWLSDGQARRLFAAGRAVPAGGRALEIGSYRGRSAIVLAQAVPADAEVVAVDPHAGNDRGPQQIDGTPDEGQDDNEAFRANLRRTGVADRVRHVRRPSTDAHDAVEGQLDLLYVDGAHRYVPARDDIAHWGARVRTGGTMLIHDAFSSVGVTGAQARLLLASRRWRYLGRSRSMAEYRREDLGLAASVGSAVRQLAQLPWFARNLVVKAAIVAGLDPVARLLGHREGPWPY
ncbi:MAG: class I SAM-dependent methyltransferase [Solirubrobacterales bacterium]